MSFSSVVMAWAIEGNPMFRNRTAEAFDVAWRGYTAAESFQQQTAR
jgi:hypothetical protein